MTVARSACAADDAHGTRDAGKQPFPEAALQQWFDQRSWTVQPFQRELWQHYREGFSGLLHAPTGSGKTLAVWGGPLLAALSGSTVAPPRRSTRSKPRRRLRHLWITPLRALAADTLANLRQPAADLGLDWEIGLRTGDASAAQRRHAREGRLDALVTTPESLALMLSYSDMAPVLSGLESVIVDEWHELLGSKRGVLLQLGLARLRRLAPGLRVWGLSASLGNLRQALDVLCPNDPDARLISAGNARELQMETLLPEGRARFPWAGHLGLAQLPRVMPHILAARSTLLFTNTRSQAELWHQALSSVWPEEPGGLALHHGSLDSSLRSGVELALREGRMRCVVATSSLDLGVDFAAVDQVIQLGSPKGIARMLQRAGRSGHRPGQPSRLLCVPTHALELVEFAAARAALAAGRIESRLPPTHCIDVLAQHLATLALGGGFEPDDILPEVRSTHAFHGLTDHSWSAVLDFIRSGGSALASYPDFRRVEVDAEGVFRMPDRRIALRHRLSVGTIVSDGALRVKLMKGGDLGAIEEQFLGRLRPGDRFLFAGRTLELVQLRDMTAFVRIAKTPGGNVPRWMGSKMPLSTELADGVLAQFEKPDRRLPEILAAEPLMDLQRRLSASPARDSLLAELIGARGGSQLFLYPFAGREVHEGLAALLATRWARRQPNSFTWAVNDYGLLLSPAAAVEVDASLLRELLGGERLLDDIGDSLNLAELARRQFREIARIAGLLPPSMPGQAKRSMRQLQASSGLIFDVLQRFDPEHLLLAQSSAEVAAGALDIQRLQATLESLRTQPVDLQRPVSLTPLAFPLWAEFTRGALSTEDWRTRIERAAARLERQHAV